MTAQQVKTGLANGSLSLGPGFPRLRYNMSEFQQERTRQAFKVADLYFRRGLTVVQIAERLGVTHQRVTQILKLAVRRLIEAGHLNEVRQQVENP